jgi:hypothetical protein
MLTKIKNILLTALGAITLIALSFGVLSLWTGFWGRTFVLPAMADSMSWPRVDGIVYEQDIDRNWDDHFFHAELSYRYTVDGVRFANDDICFFQKESNCGFGTDDFKEAEELLALYPEGSRVTIFYDPEDPGQAVLQPEDVTPELRAEMDEHIRFGGLSLVAGLVLAAVAVKLGLGADEEL